MIAQDRQPYVNTRQDNQFQFFGSPTVMRSTGDTTDGHFCLLESLSMPPGLASPYHVHHREDEAFYILEGTVAFLCGDTWQVAGPGTYVYGPRDIPHGFRVIGTSPARSSNTTVRSPWSGPSAPVAARTKAVPMLGWPANGTSCVGVKIRTRRVWPASGGSTKAVSE